MPRRKRVQSESEEEEEEIVEEQEEEVEDEEEEEEDQPKKSNKKRSKRVADEDDDEDGEYEIGDGDGDGDEDDSDDGELEFDESEFDDGFGPDLIGDEEDRNYIDSLPDLKREEILYERSQKREKLQEAKAAKLRATEAKRAAMAAEGKEKGKKSQSRAAKSKGKTRGATKLSKNDALGDLMARRKGKVAGKITDSISYEEEEQEEEESEESEESGGERRRRKSRGKTRGRRARDDDYYNEEEASADDQERDSDQEDAAEETRTPIRLQDVINVQLRRTAIEKVFQEPYFSEFCKGMFTRVTVGEKHGVADYRLCEIEGLLEAPKEYSFAGQRTKMAFRLKFGRAERTFPFSSVSNHSVQDGEFKRWIEEMDKCGLQPISMEEAIARHKKALATKETFTYTPEVVQQVIAKKRQEGKLAFNPSLEKTKLAFELEQAKAEIDNASTSEERRGYLEQKIEDVKQRLAQIEATERDARDRKALGDMKTILAINNRAREQNEINLQTMLRLEKEEKKKENSSGRERKLDAFKRRATRPEMNWNLAEEEKKEEKKDAAASKHDQSGQSAAKAEEDLDSKVRSLLQSAASSASASPSGASHSIVPPSRVNPSLDHPGVLHLPRAPAAERNRSILSSLHSFPLDIDFSATSQKPLFSLRQSPSIIDPRYVTLPPGSKSLTLDEYWQRRDQEEEAMQQ